MPNNNHENNLGKTDGVSVGSRTEDVALCSAAKKARHIYLKYSYLCMIKTTVWEVLASKYPSNVGLFTCCIYRVLDTQLDHMYPNLTFFVSFRILWSDMNYESHTPVHLSHTFNKGYRMEILFSRNMVYLPWQHLLVRLITMQLILVRSSYFSKCECCRLLSKVLQSISRCSMHYITRNFGQTRGVSSHRRPDTSRNSSLSHPRY